MTTHRTIINHLLTLDDTTDETDHFNAIRTLLIDARDDLSPFCDETTACQLKFLIALCDDDDIRELCEMTELCTMHHIDLAICIDDNDTECAHLRD